MSPDNEILLQARSIGRHADDGRWLLREIDISICKGDRIAVLGPSGAGKSLLLRTLCLLDQRQAGTLHWQDEEILHRVVPQFRSQVMYVRQRPAAFETSVEEYWQAPFQLKTYRSREFDRNHAVRLLNTINRGESFLEKRGSDLSGGEAQIAALVCSLQLSPTILLLDEPTAALDPATTSAVEQLVLTWLDEDSSRAALWVTHDESQATRFAKSVIRLDKGRLAEAG